MTVSPIDVDREPYALLAFFLPLSDVRVLGNRKAPDWIGRIGVGVVIHRSDSRRHLAGPI